MPNSVPSTVEHLFLKQVLGQLQAAARRQITFSQAFGTTLQGTLRPGDTEVKIPQILVPKNRDYSPEVRLILDRLGSRVRKISMEEAKYFQILIEDLEQFRVSQDLQAFVSTEKAAEFAEELDTYCASEIDTILAGTSGDLGTLPLTGSNAARKAVAHMRTILKRQSALKADGSLLLIAPPEFTELLIQDSALENSVATAGQVLLNGEVGRVGGARVIESVNTTNADGTSAGIYLLSGKVGERVNQFQLDDELIKVEGFFGDVIRGLHVFGASVTQPQNIVKAEIAVDAVAAYENTWDETTAPGTQTDAGILRPQRPGTRSTADGTPVPPTSGSGNTGSGSGSGTGTGTGTSGS